MREKIVNNRVREFTRQFTVLHNDKISNIGTIGQEGVIKRYSSSRFRQLLEQPSKLDDSIIERKIEDRHYKSDRDPNEPELDGDRVRLNVDE